jgi:hypothetical protein
MQHDLKVGAVSWIDEKPSPIWFSGKAAALEPDWVPKTYMGLVATANQPPAATIADFATYRKGKDFRALMYCHLRVTIDDRSQQITKVAVIDAFHDPGWTPPFRVRTYPLSGLKFWDEDIWSFDWHAGEASPISVVRTEARHSNSAIASIPKGDCGWSDQVPSRPKHRSHWRWSERPLSVSRPVGLVRDGGDVRRQAFYVVRSRLNLPDALLVFGWREGSYAKSSRRCEFPLHACDGVSAAECPLSRTSRFNSASAYD